MTFRVSFVSKLTVLGTDIPEGWFCCKSPFTFLSAVFAGTLDSRLFTCSSRWMDLFEADEDLPFVSAKGVSFEFEVGVGQRTEAHVALGHCASVHGGSWRPK